MGIPFLIIYILARVYLYESPRFLVQRKRFAEARETLNKICAKNKRPHLEYRLEGEEDGFEERGISQLLLEPDLKKKESEFFNYEN